MLSQQTPLEQQSETFYDSGVTHDRCRVSSENGASLDFIQSFHFIEFYLAFTPVVAFLKSLITFDLKTPPRRLLNAADRRFYAGTLLTDCI